MEERGLERDELQVKLEAEDEYQVRRHVSNGEEGQIAADIQMQGLK